MVVHHRPFRNRTKQTNKNRTELTKHKKPKQNIKTKTTNKENNKPSTKKKHTHTQNNQIDRSEQTLPWVGRTSAGSCEQPQPSTPPPQPSSRQRQRPEHSFRNGFLPFFVLFFFPCSLIQHYQREDSRRTSFRTMTI